LVHKIKNTPTQVSVKDRAERLKNLSGAFQLSSANLTGRIVVIIDDVSTTGATINEIRHILKPTGASKVYGLVVAHG